MSSDWIKQDGSAGLIIEDSDPEDLDDFSQIARDPADLLKKLPALNPILTEIQHGNIDNHLEKKFSIRKTMMQDPDPPGSQNGHHAGQQPQQQAGTGGQGGGNGGEQAPGGGGGGAGGDDNEDDEHNEEGGEAELEDPHHEQAESTPNSSNESGSMPPPLVRPGLNPNTPPRPIPQSVQHREALQQVGSPSGHPSGRETDTASEAAGATGEDTPPGGISEASTAVVSDTEGRGQIISSGEVRQNQPGTSAEMHVRNSPRRVVSELSSAVSSLSSSYSSSSGERTTAANRAQRKRPPTRKMANAAKRGRYDTSTSTSTTTTNPNTSTSTHHTTTSDTSHDTSHERLSGDRSHDQGDGEQDGHHDDEPHPSGSQEDMFHGGSQGGGDHDNLSTIPESVDPVQSVDVIPPSVDVFDPPSESPKNISTTAMYGSHESPHNTRKLRATTKAQSSSNESSSNGQKSELGQPAVLYVGQEWQPSFPTLETTSRSSSASLDAGKTRSSSSASNNDAPSLVKEDTADAESTKGSGSQNVSSQNNEAAEAGRRTRRGVRRRPARELVMEPPMSEDLRSAAETGQAAALDTETSLQLHISQETENFAEGKALQSSVVSSQDLALHFSQSQDEITSQKQQQSNANTSQKKLETTNPKCMDSIDEIILSESPRKRALRTRKLESSQKAKNSTRTHSPTIDQESSSPVIALSQNPSQTSNRKSTRRLQPESPLTTQHLMDTSPEDKKPEVSTPENADLNLPTVESQPDFAEEATETEDTGFLIKRPVISTELSEQPASTSVFQVEEPEPCTSKVNVGGNPFETTPTRRTLRVPHTVSSPHQAAGPRRSKLVFVDTDTLEKVSSAEVDDSDDEDTATFDEDVDKKISQSKGLQESEAECDEQADSEVQVNRLKKKTPSLVYSEETESMQMEESGNANDDSVLREEDLEDLMDEDEPMDIEKSVFKSSHDDNNSSQKDFNKNKAMKKYSQVKAKEPQAAAKQSADSSVPVSKPSTPTSLKRDGKKYTHSPKPWEVPKPRGKKQRQVSKVNRPGGELTGHGLSASAPTDPYEYRLSQSQKDEAGKKEVLGLKERARMRDEVSSIELARANESTSIRAEMETTGMQTSQSIQGSRLETTGMQTSQSLHASKLEQVSSSVQTPPVHFQVTGSGSGSHKSSGQKVVKTTVIETVTKHVITIVDEIVDGKTVRTYRANEDTKIVSQNFSQHEEVVSVEPSPPRSVHTSGEFADVSSLSTVRGDRSSTTASSTHSAMNITSGPSAEPSLVEPPPHDCDKVDTHSSHQPIVTTEQMLRRRTLLDKTSSCGSLKGATPAPSPILPHLTHISHLTDDSLADVSGHQEKNDERPALVDKEEKMETDNNNETAEPKSHTSNVQNADASADTEMLYCEEKAHGEEDKTEEKGSRRKSSSASYKSCESLFSSVSDKSGRKVSLGTSTSSSFKQSASLFSTSSVSDVHESRHQADEEGFTKPSDIPLASSRRKSSLGSSTSTNKSSILASDKSLESDTVIPDTIPKGDKSSYIKASTKESTLIEGIEKPDNETSKVESASGESESTSSTLILPPYKPQADDLKPGTSVLGMWLDKHYYPGQVVAKEGKDKFTVAFEDGDVRIVRLSHLIVCDLLCVGQECLAEHGDVFFEAVVVGHYNVGQVDRGCIVRFVEDNKTKRVGRGHISLSNKQVEDLVTTPVLMTSAKKENTSKDDSTKTGDEKKQSKKDDSQYKERLTEQKEKDDATVDENIIQEKEKQTESKKKDDANTSAEDTDVVPPTDDERPRIRRIIGTLERIQEEPKTRSLSPRPGPSTPVIKDPEPYTPADPYTACGDLDKKTPVIARWADGNYYPGRIMGFDSRTEKYRVRFDDGNTGHVKMGHLYVCELVGVGHCVFALREDEWKETAVVAGHYKCGQETGYWLHLDSGDRVRLPRSQVFMNKDMYFSFVHDTCKKPREAAMETDTDTESEVSFKPGAGDVGDVDEVEDYIPDEPSKVHDENLEAGIKVIARWADKNYYPGEVVFFEPSKDKYKIKFEDGDIQFVKINDIIKCELVGTGQSVYALKENGWKMTAVVAGHYRHGEEIGYWVHLDSGERIRLTRGDVFLDHDMFMSLVGFNTSLVATPKLGDVSLDNLVPGKRRRILTPSQESPKQSPKPREESPIPSNLVRKQLKDGGNRTPKSTTPFSSPQSSSKKISHPRRLKKEDSLIKQAVATSRSTSSSSKKSSEQKGGSDKDSGKDSDSDGKKSVKKRRMRDIEPTYASTPTPTRAVSALVKPVTEEKLAPGMFESPQHVRKSPRKARAGLFTDVKGPLPTDRIFQGITVLLTSIQRPPGSQQKTASSKKKNDSSTTTTDESFVEEETVPYDKDHLTSQIQAGGGVVMEKFDYNTVLSAKQVIVVSDTYQRTLKYFLGLAAGLPLVSHVWVRDSCKQNILQAYKSYVLPAGISIESNDLSEWTSRTCSPFHSTKVLISTNNQAFLEVYTKVLQAAGCRVVTTFPRSTDGLLTVLGDRSTSQSVVDKAKELGIPLVSCEWVIQCLITGILRDFNGHPKYEHDF